MRLLSYKRNLTLAAVFAAATVAATPAAAASITITAENPGAGTFDNVLFNDASLQHSGTFVEGNFNGTGAGFVVQFESDSGTQLLTGSGGQATVDGGLGNDPYTNLLFFLQDGATFTAAVMNIDTTVDGDVQFVVSYILGDGGPTHTETFNLDGAGQNFYHVAAGDGARILSIEINALGNVAINDSNQFRLAGFAERGINQVPEPAILGLLGAGLVVGIRRFRRKQA